VSQSEPQATFDRQWRWLARALAALLILLGFFPLANWFGGGHTAPWYGDVAQSWISGTAIIVGTTVVLLVLSRGRVLELATRAGRLGGERFDASPWLVSSVVAVVAFAIYALCARTIFDAQPIFIDEIVQVYQARLLASGVLVERVGPFAEFFSALNVVTQDGKQFGQFPPGGPAHLVPAVLLGATWLAVPVIGAVTVFAFGALVRRVESEPGVALGALLLFAFSPFMIFMSASHMNHVPTLLWVLVAWFAALRVLEFGSTRWAMIFGAAASIAATIRPVDAVAMTLPAAVAMAWSRRDRARDLVAAAVAVLAGASGPVLLLLAYNNATTGSPFLFGYELLWGKSHSLGFHTAPWGATHTPVRGLELLNLYVLRLQSYLFESAAPSLLPVIATLLLVRRLVRFDVIALSAVVLLALGYFAYWHDGFYLGPRFVFVLTPVFALLAARAPREVAARVSARDVRPYAYLGLVLFAGFGWALGAPQRAQAYARGLASVRAKPTHLVDSLGIERALIFVRESWGSQVLARLWGREVSRVDAELLYRSVDTCRLDSAISRLEANGTRGAAARDALWPLLRDSALVDISDLSPDRTQRVQRGIGYTPACLAQVARDREGFGLYPPVLAAARGSNVYARDLGARNTELRVRYAERDAYILVPASPEAGGARLLRVDR
jgi:hypothetical protein